MEKIKELKLYDSYQNLGRQWQENDRKKRESEFIQKQIDQGNLVFEQLSKSLPTGGMQVKFDQRRRTQVSLGGTPKLPAKLVPIRIDLDIEGYKLRDLFLWNLNEEYLGVEEFVSITLKDFDIPWNVMGLTMVSRINDQITEHKEVIRLIEESGGVSQFRGIRVKLKIDVTIGMMQLKDQIDWDLGEERNDPIEFSRQFIEESELSSEFIVPIAIDIIEQIQNIRRALIVVGFHWEGSQIKIQSNDSDLYTILSNPIPPSSARNIAPTETFKLLELDPLVLEKLEANRDRESRAKKRHHSKKHENHINWASVAETSTILTPLSYKGSVHRHRVETDDDNDKTGNVRKSRRKKQAFR